MKGARQLSDEEIRKIVQCFSGRYKIRNRTLFILGLACGGRISAREASPKATSFAHHRRRPAVRKASRRCAF